VQGLSSTNLLSHLKQLLQSVNHFERQLREQVRTLEQTLHEYDESTQPR